MKTAGSGALKSPEERELDALATLVDAHERKRFPILPLDPVQAIKLRCEQLGWTRKNLEPIHREARGGDPEARGGERARVREPATQEGHRRSESLMRQRLKQLPSGPAPLRSRPSGGLLARLSSGSQS